MTNNLRFFLVIFLLFISVGCKDKNPASPKKKAGKTEKIISEAKVEDWTINGNWQCYKFDKGRSINDLFPMNYALEFSRNAFFTIQDKEIILADGTRKAIYSYRFPTHKEDYNAESEFLEFIHPKSDSVTFYAQFNTSDIVEPYHMIFVHKNEIVIQDRGYFFLFKKVKERETDAVKITGCPGDNRNAWKVTHDWSAKSMDEALQKFKRTYPYGGVDLVSKKPQKGMIDSKGIEYTLDKKGLTIYKADPMGQIKIEIQQISDQKYRVNYSMEYMEFG
jgi:hypothetical protein